MSGLPRLGRGDVVRLLEEAGVHPSKALGQNFVVDPNLTERIARLAGVGPGDAVLEIGAGLGSLSVALVRTGAALTVVEIDHRLAPLLASLLPAGVRVVEADALELHVEELYPEETTAAGSVVLVANLPYNVATPLVLRLLEHAGALGRMVVMVQREVAERFTATPGTRAYGAVSARIAYFADARLVFAVAPEVFYPRPSVTSAVIELRRRESVAVAPEVASYEEIVELVRRGFAGRRKMLRRSLQGLVDEESFRSAGIASTLRAEDLSILEWGKLARCRRDASSREPS